MKLEKIHKIGVSTIGILMTILVCKNSLLQEKPNVYKIYMNGVPTAYVNKVEDFTDAWNSLSSNVLNRFSSSLTEQITYEKVRANNVKVQNEKEISETLKNNVFVNAVVMKSDEKEVSILANKEEIDKALINVKEKLIKEEKNNYEIGKIKSNITYTPINIQIQKVDTIDYTVHKIQESKDRPIVSFEKIIKKAKENIVSPKSDIVTSSKVYLIAIPTLGNISSEFGERYDPILKVKAYHPGIDVAADMGTPIYAALNGVVEFAGWEEGYGNLIKIKNGDMLSLYGHCSKIIVKKGEKISKGQQIGNVGSTGKSTGPHVHFEIRINGKAVDPQKYLGLR